MANEDVGAPGSEIVHDSVMGGLAGGGFGGLLAGGIAWEGSHGLPPVVRRTIAIPAAVAGAIAGAGLGALTMGGAKWWAGKSVKTAVAVPIAPALGKVVKAPSLVGRRPQLGATALRKVPGMGNKVAFVSLSSALAKLAAGGDVDNAEDSELDPCGSCGGSGKKKRMKKTAEEEIPGPIGVTVDAETPGAIEAALGGVIDPAVFGLALRLQKTARAR